MPIDPLTIAFALVAAFLVYKLYTVLGENRGLRSGKAERLNPPPPRGPEPAPSWRKPAADPGVKAGDRGVSRFMRLPTSKPSAPLAPPPDPARFDAHVETPAATVPGLLAIAQAEPSFAADPFLEGARSAYETILTAFAAGDAKALEPLLDKAVLAGFSAAIEDRAQRGETLAVTFVSVEKPRIVSAELAGRTARVGVRFRSKQISAHRASDGALLPGGSDAIHDVNDIWTFARTVNSRDPNWKLVATEAGL